MSNLENGYVHVDDSGDLHYVSYDSIGGGIFLIALLVIATIFLKEANSYIVSNKWIVVIPTAIAVIIRTILYDGQQPMYKRTINIISDIIKTICMYGVLLIVLDKIANAHWLDRVLFALFYGTILFVAYYILNTFIISKLRGLHFCFLHVIVCLFIAAISLLLYFNHTWYCKGYDYKTFFGTATIVEIDERMEGNIEIPEKINSYTIKNIKSGAFIHNKKITRVKLPNTIETIDDYAFWGCHSLKIIDIPISVKCIGYGAFDFDDSISDIFYEGTQEEWEKISIKCKDSLKNIKIHFGAE